MTYFAVLAIFVLPPLLLMAALLLRLQRDALFDRRSFGVLFLHIVLALVYTTPWDNYLVRTGVWWYDPRLVTGVRLGYVPLEEYIFFILQTLLTGAWYLLVSRLPVFARLSALPGRRYRLLAGLGGGLAWLGSIVLLVSGWQPGLYLALILVWALVPVLIQIVFGADILAANWRLVAATVLPPTLYLWAVDALAIAGGTWTLSPAATTGVLLGSLPLEEMVFFLMTNLIIGFGMTLMLSPASMARGKKMLERILGWRGTSAGSTRLPFQGGKQQ